MHLKYENSYIFMIFYEVIGIFFSKNLFVVIIFKSRKDEKIKIPKIN